MFLFMFIFPLFILLSCPSPTASLLKFSSLYLFELLFPPLSLPSSSSKHRLNPSFPPCLLASSPLFSLHFLLLHHDSQRSLLMLTSRSVYRQTFELLPHCSPYTRLRVNKAGPPLRAQRVLPRPMSTLAIFAVVSTLRFAPPALRPLSSFVTGNLNLRYVWIFGSRRRGTTRLLSVGYNFHSPPPHPTLYTRGSAR